MMGLVLMMGLVASVFDHLDDGISIIMGSSK